MAYERRNRDLDPQLIWRGKDTQDWSDLVVHAPPLYIQEKVHPKVLLEVLPVASEQWLVDSKQQTTIHQLQTTSFAAVHWVLNDQIHVFGQAETRDAGNLCLQNLVLRTDSPPAESSVGSLARSLGFGSLRRTLDPEVMAAWEQKLTTPNDEPRQ